VEADIIVSATGLVVKVLGGAELVVDGERVDPPERLFYKGMMLEGVPNLALASGYTNASWTLKCDLIAQYACRLINHLDRSGHDICVPCRTSSDIRPLPMVDFSSGYIQRAMDIMPRQGDRGPWRLHQNYIFDRFALRLGRLEDGTMQFRDAAERAAA
jgi:cation diffusion facilitator CzcD-associated flavoprotein CzcO